VRSTRLRSAGRWVEAYGAHLLHPGGVKACSRGRHSKGPTEGKVAATWVRKGARGAVLTKGGDAVGCTERRASEKKVNDRQENKTAWRDSRGDWPGGKRNGERLRDTRWLAGVDGRRGDLPALGNNQKKSGLVIRCSAGAGPCWLQSNHGVGTGRRDFASPGYKTIKGLRLDRVPKFRGLWRLFAESRSQTTFRSDSSFKELKVHL